MIMTTESQIASLQTNGKVNVIDARGNTITTINIVQIDESNQSISSSTTTTPGPCGSTGDESELNYRETASPESDDGNGVFNFSRNLRVGPKSVCFHSETCQPGEKKITSALDCLQHMMNGTTLIKVKASTRQYRRFFALEEDLSAVRWLPSSKKSAKAKLSIKTIKEIRSGKNTEVMKYKEIASQYSEDCIFSIIHGDEFETLDLIALSPEEANIWVTGLNFLMGASKSPDAYEGRQKMREKWLHQVFDQADADRKGMLDEWETIALMKKLNDKLCVRSLKQKIMEFEFGKDELERGRISKNNFITLFTEAATRPDIYFILVRYCGRDYMTLEELQLFLEGEQGIHGLSLEDCENLILKYELSEEARSNRQLCIDGFTQLMVSEECDIMSPRHRNIIQDMSQPLAHYFISCSHNTYLLQDQLKGPSSIEGYSRALLQGCRCIKIDCWDGTDSNPVVYHGNTLTSKVLLEDVLETINAHAFVMSEFPLIINLENHCSLETQKQVASLLISILGSLLYIPKNGRPLNPMHVSPAQLRGKIIIKGKKLPHDEDDDGQVTDEDDTNFNPSRIKESQKRILLCKELSDLMSLSGKHLIDLNSFQQNQKEFQVSILSEAAASKMSLSYSEELVNHNKLYLTQVLPDISRVDSSNFNPLDFWNCGIQLVSMNYQTAGQMMDLHSGWFMQNGSCGYVLKPNFQRDKFSLFSSRKKDSLVGIDPLCLRLKIISGQQLPRPKGASSKASSIDPYVTVQLFGVPNDCAEVRTRTVSNGGHSPLFDESFEFNIAVPELSLIRFLVLDDDYINDDFIGQFTIPIECIQTGYKHVRLCSLGGDPLGNATLFVHISLTRRFSSKQRLRRKRSWSNKQSTEMRSIGIKSIDEQFKSASMLIQESMQLRKAAEKAMIDLSDECCLSESANMAQCLRVITLRLASCQSVNSCEIVTTEQGYTTLKADGELTPKLSKTVNALDKAAFEFHFTRQNAISTLDLFKEIHDEILESGNQMNTTCNSLGIKGRKADKIYENFIWNMNIFKTEINLLEDIKNDCDNALNQMRRIASSLVRIFQRERDSLASSRDIQNVPVVLAGATLNPEPELKQPPPTPTSPGDGRLRGILKKTNHNTKLTDDQLEQSSDDSANSSPKLLN